MYVDKDGTQHAELIEIKPFDQTGQVKTRSRNNALAAVKNAAKWAAAQAYCEKNGLKFRVITERELFHMGGGTL